MGRTSSEIAGSIYEDLSRAIKDGEYLIDAPLPSENELALKHGTSRFLARKALVLLEKDGLAVSRPGAGRKVARRLSGIGRLAVLVLGSHDYMDESAPEDMPVHVSGWRAGVFRACEKLGIFPLLMLKTCHGLEDSLSIFHQALKSNIDAIIIRVGLSGRDRAAFVHEVKDCGTPYLFNCNLSGLEDSNFFIGDDYAAGRLMAGHLVGRGHKEVGFICSSLGLDFNYFRYRGVVDALAAAGLPLRQDAFHQSNIVLDNDRQWLEVGRVGVEALADSGALKRLSSIICVNDASAAGAIKALGRHGLKVPGDISVTGFDNDPRQRHLCLTTGHFPYAEKSVEITERFVKHVNAGSTTVFKEFIDPVLIPGKTDRGVKGKAL